MSTAMSDDPVPVSAVSRPGTLVMARASCVGDPRSAEVSHRLLVYLRWNGLKGHKQLWQAGHGAAYRRLQPALGRVRAMCVPTPFAPASHQMCASCAVMMFRREELLEDAVTELHREPWPSVCHGK